jgi:hypothetical protein
MQFLDNHRLRSLSDLIERLLGFDTDALLIFLSSPPIPFSP